MQTHQELHLSSSTFVKDMVIGMSDGLTVPFALAAGLSGAVDSNTIIITAGIAEIAAGSLAMGLGGYLAGKTEEEYFENELKKEYYEVEHMPEKERQEIKDIFKDYGISPHLQEAIANDLAKDKDKWVAFMMKYELGLEKPAAQQAPRSAFTIALSYIVGGIIPLSGYIFSSTPLDGLLISSCVTLACLLLFGYIKSKLTGQNPWKGALQVALIGAAASFAAYSLAKFFD